MLGSLGDFGALFSFKMLLLIFFLTKKFGLFIFKKWYLFKHIHTYICLMFKNIKPHFMFLTFSFY